MTQACRLASVAIAAIALPAGAARAQTHPCQPIRIVVPSSPGGPNDTVARLACQALSRLGQPAIVSACIAAERRRWTAAPRAIGAKVEE